MARPTPLSGFPELLPDQRTIEAEVLATLVRTFELHGFAGIETRSVEPLDQLLRKGETSKEVYTLRRLQEAEGAGEERGSAASTLGLHFDLTVPFARYVLEHAGRLEFPFRRHQVQKVWRGERPQEGRYREFTQADIDVVGRETLAPHHDGEVLRVMVEALARLDFLPGFTVQVNNRKLITGFYAGLGVEGDDSLADVLRVVDKLDKLPVDAVREQLVRDVGLDEAQADAGLALATIAAPDRSFAERVGELAARHGVDHPLLREGLAELVSLVEGCRGVVTERVRVVADLRIARGLDYYTGSVFETRLDGFESIGSICSGGRYDSLASDGKVTYPGVGISLGVTRMLVPLIAAGAVSASRSVPSAVLVAVTDEDSRTGSDDVATALRAQGIPCEVAPSAAKFGKQIRHAERRGIPFVWFPDAGEVKDIRSGIQVAADAATWQPPQRDLWPAVVGTHGSAGPTDPAPTTEESTP